MLKEVEIFFWFGLRFLQLASCSHVAKLAVTTLIGPFECDRHLVPPIAFQYVRWIQAFHPMFQVIDRPQLKLTGFFFCFKEYVRRRRDETILCRIDGRYTQSGVGELQQLFWSWWLVRLSSSTGLSPSYLRHFPPTEHWEIHHFSQGESLLLLCPRSRRLRLQRCLPKKKKKS